MHLTLPRSPSRTEELLERIAPIATKDRLQIFLANLPSAGVATVGHLHHMSMHYIATAALGPSASAPDPPPPPALTPAASCMTRLFTAPPLDLGPCIVSCVRTDRSDGLFPTLVLETDGTALGLVYSSPDSISAALRCGRGVYWSRSRQSLWRKGDTSGAWQTLRRIRLDCDADALAFTVSQHGVPPAFCHKGSLSCWGQASGLPALVLTLRQRQASAPVGSYTKRLFDDATLLRNKLVEEAQELAEATEPDHVAAEAADLLYFALVRCVAAGVGIEAVEAHLDRRALNSALKGRRPGNDKAERIEAANAILAKSKAKECGKCAPSRMRRLAPLAAAAVAAAAFAVRSSLKK